MRVLALLSNFMIPIIIFYIVGYGIMNREKVYDIFIDGVKDGFKIVLGIAPTIVGLMVAVAIVRSSGALDLIAKHMVPIGEFLHVPAEVIPIIIVRMFSTSAANGLVFDIFKEFGPDSKAGFMVSIIMSCTESIFYIMSVYLMSVKIKKPRWILVGGLLATFAGVVASIVMANISLA